MSPYARPEDEFAAAGLTWLLDTFVTPFVEAGKQKWKDQQECKRWIDALHSYKESLLRHYGTLRVLGQSEDVPLDAVFTDVLVLDRLTAQRRFDIRELMEKQIERYELHEQNSKRVNGIGLVNQGHNLYVLGKPGAGKTTFLKWITTRSIDGKLTNRRLPIFVSLHEWSNSHYRYDLLPFIVGQLEVHQFPSGQTWLELLLEEGRALLLFDGLDEVRQEDGLRSNLSLLLRNFTKKYDRSQYLITCRIAASDYIFPNFQTVEVADFTGDQVKIYARKWFRDQDIKYERFWEELKKSENQGLRELCNVPLLLSMLCLYFDDTMSFPARRAELYEDALDALLRKWDSSRQIQREGIYQTLSHKRKQQMLAHVATPAFENGEYYFTTRKLADSIATYLSNLPGSPPVYDIDGESVLRAIEAQHGVLVERAHNIHSFSHLSFQEYFTARYIVDNEARRTTKSLIQKHLTDSRWREVFLLTASMLDNADDFIVTMRSSVDALVAEDAEIVDILQWAETRCLLYADHKQQSGIRLIYLALALSAENTRKRALTLDTATENVRNFARSSDLRFAHSATDALTTKPTINSSVTSSLAQMLFRDVSSPLLHLLVSITAREGQMEVDFARLGSLANRLTASGDFYHAQSLITDLSNSLNEVQSSVLSLNNSVQVVRESSTQAGSDYSLYLAWSIATVLADVERLSEQRKLYRQSWPHLLSLYPQISFYIRLENLMPPASADQLAWRVFANSLGNMLKEEGSVYLCDGLSKEQVSRINTYLYANELLVRCLDLAFVTDRQGVLSSLLLPPKLSK